jgi:hypothetical protein
VVLAHDAPGPQAVLVDPCWHPLAPSHLPVLPQGRAAAHWPAGAVVPAASGVHVPGDVPAQVWHVPQLEAVQQTPSVQLALEHSWAAVQVAPFAFLVVQPPGVVVLPVQ